MAHLDRQDIHYTARVRKLFVAFAASIVLTMVASASAQASWSDIAPTKNYHCGANISAPHTPFVSSQSCVLVYDSPSGSYVQAVTRVTNTNDNPHHSISPNGYATLWVDGHLYRSDNCGTTGISGRKTKWCYGKTMFIPGYGRYVWAYGYVWYGAGVHDAVRSASWKTATMQDKAVTWATSKVGTTECSSAQTGWASAYNSAFHPQPPFTCRTPWCGIFVREVYRAAGVDLGAIAATETIYGNATANRNRMFGVASTQILKGDLVLMYTYYAPGRHVTHVGIATGNYSNGQIPTVEGNISDKVGTGSRSTTQTVSGHKLVVMGVRIK